MPFPSEHAARQQEPKRYSKFRRGKPPGFPAGLEVIWGILPNGKTEIQSIRADASKWTVERFKKWLAAHNFKTGIEAASGQRTMSDEQDSPEVPGEADRDISGLLTREAAVTFVGTGEDRSIRVTASTQDEDSHGTILRNWDLSRYAANPTVLFAHNHFGYPIGTSDEVEEKDGKLSARLNLLEKDDNPDAERCLKLFRKKAMRAVSVGFCQGPKTKVTTEYRENGRSVLVIDGPQLSEISAIAVGSNAGALAQLRALAVAQHSPALEPVNTDGDEPMTDSVTEGTALENKIAERDAKITDLETRIVKTEGLVAQFKRDAEAHKAMADAHEIRVKELQTHNTKLVRQIAEDKLRGFIGTKITPAQSEAILKFADVHEVFDEKLRALKDWPDMPIVSQVPALPTEQPQARSIDGSATDPEVKLGHEILAEALARV